ncbi:MAG: hypothetical protein EOM87_04600, partial [Clostridia bacterium]|nr:hypothetical protein [Clostridia bacterium]
LESKSFCRSVAAFVDYYTEHEEDIEWGKGDMSAENGVNVCTIHASKGLEYPVVILAGTGCYMNKSGRQSPTQVDKTLGIGMNYYDKKTRCIIPSIVMNAIANKKKIEEREDALRLFYVALTRAKSHLIITGAISDNKYSKTASVNKATSYFEWLLAVAQKVKSVAGLINLYRIRADISEAVEEKKVFFGAPSPDIAEKISREFEYNYPYKSSVDVGIKYSATGINKEEDIVIPSLFEEERRIRGVDYHKIMQYIDYNCATLEEISAELKRMLSEGLISDEECASVDMYDILKCLSSPVMRYAGLNKCLREQRFMLAEYANEVKDTLAKDQILIQGTIDLVILGEETVIVDFKYSRLTDDVLKQKYATQLKIYKKAVESGMNIKVDKLILYIFGTGKVITL